MQLELFGKIAGAYASSPNGQLTNEELYSLVESDRSIVDKRVPIGAAKALHSPFKRQIRWWQQDMRQQGILVRVSRGTWQLANGLRDELKRATDNVKVVAFSTKLGVAIWSNNLNVYRGINEPIHLCFTSPPYLLRTPRDYGGPTEEVEYVDFICAALEGVVRNLVPGGMIALNLSQDAFLEGSPARSLYLERLTIALSDRLGLFLMDRHVWHNRSKPPGPTYWACVKRVQVASAFEFVLRFTNDPHRARSDNQRCLEPHSPRHLALMAAGGEARVATYGDGAYRLKPGSFGRRTEGRLPRNVIEVGHACRDTREYRKFAKAANLPLHGAIMPTKVASHMIELCTQEGELVVDIFGGVGKTALAAERLNRRWLITEIMLNYMRGSSSLFRQFAGYHQSRLINV